MRTQDPTSKPIITILVNNTETSLLDRREKLTPDSVIPSFKLRPDFWLYHDLHPFQERGDDEVEIGRFPTKEEGSNEVDILEESTELFSRYSTEPFHSCIIRTHFLDLHPESCLASRAEVGFARLVDMLITSLDEDGANG